MTDLRQYYPEYQEIDIFSISKITEIEKIKTDYSNIPELVDKNKRGNRCYSSAINNYIKYLDQKENIVYSDKHEQEKLNNIISKQSVNSMAIYKGQKKSKLSIENEYVNKAAYPRDVAVAANAVKIAKYQCEIDANHPSFIRRTNGKNYTESHHLIPMKDQDDFEYSLDVEENIVSLCSNCHNCLHYGADESREAYLAQLWEKRKVMLEKVGLKIEIETLKKYYDFKE